MDPIQVRLKSDMLFMLFWQNIDIIPNQFVIPIFFSPSNSFCITGKLMRGYTDVVETEQLNPKIEPRKFYWREGCVLLTSLY